MSLRGSNTAVVVGCGFEDVVIFCPEEIRRKNGYTFPGSARSMISNMVSYAFDFKGSFMFPDNSR